MPKRTKEEIAAVITVQDWCDVQIEKIGTL